MRLIYQTNKQIQVIIYVLYIQFIQQIRMRQKTDSLTDKFEYQKFQLQGWSNDAQDLQGCNNLLKILQKKITFPVLQNNQKSRKNLGKKIQTLPAVYQNPRKPSQRDKPYKVDYFELSPKIYIQKRIKKQTYIKQPQLVIPMIQSGSGIKKCKTEKKNLCILNKFTDQNDCFQIIASQNAHQQITKNYKKTSNNNEKQKYPVTSKQIVMNQQNQVLNTKQAIMHKEKAEKKKLKKPSQLNNTFLNFFSSIKGVQKQKDQKQKKNQVSKLCQLNKKKHQKIASVQIFPIKSKIALFDEYNINDDRLAQKKKQKGTQITKKQKNVRLKNQSSQNKQQNKKLIKWQRFSLSQEKFNAKAYKIKQMEINPNVDNNQELRDTHCKVFENQLLSGQKMHPNYTKMFWMERILQKSKFKLAQHHSSHSSTLQGPNIKLNKIKNVVRTQANDFVDEHLQSHQDNKFLQQIQRHKKQQI